MKLKYLVTGTGRCGTVYMARFLTQIGINCGHEAIFDHNGLEMAIQKINGEVPINTSFCSRYNHVTQESSANWFNPKIEVLAESSYMAAPYLNDPILNDVKIIHLARNPLEVLSSWVLDIHFFDKKTKSIAHFREFIYSHVPQIQQEKTEIEKACRYIIEWNKIIENSSREKIFLKIENYPYVSLINFLHYNVDLTKIIDNKKINSWRKRTKDLTINDIPKGNTRDEFVEYTNRYFIKIT